MTDIDEIILAHASTREWGEEPVFDDDLPGDLSELWALVNRAKAIRASAQAVTKALKREMGVQLAGRRVRFGDVLIRFGETTTYRVIDSDAFWDWYEAEVVVSEHRLLWNPNYVKRGALRDLHGESVIDTFYASHSEPGVIELPRSRWPKSAHKMREGEVT